MRESYSPTHPEIDLVSSDEDEADNITGDNVDPEFQAKLNELFGPISP